MVWRETARAVFHRPLSSPGLSIRGREDDAAAQQITGVPGSPSAATTITGEQLPPPKFGGKIERNAAQSTPYWPPCIEPPEGAPNVLLIMTDDAGFGVPSTFGGVIPTPSLDRIAQNGLRYTNFHSMALCSPTRAALITGQPHPHGVVRPSGEWRGCTGNGRRSAKIVKGRNWQHEQRTHRPEKQGTA